jgi:hypothetical protein
MFNQLLQGSKIEAWLLNRFRDYRPGVNGLDDMKDGVIKKLLQSRINPGLDRFYGKNYNKKSRKKDDSLDRNVMKVSFLGIYTDYLSIVTNCIV